ncbi:MAG TPA: hypothetical protein PLG17_12540 [Thermodesulfobacteriota bacterium]|nr:hypothetical protein [Deltaproteobacteria bacterium]HNR14252.1 hypothetical protein [Thermodesulfobacteriota bacterium]HNU71341.1 hypothetical protein [Thermodesulfobacteriota bacterium]HOC39287.1 hypothetical protein [Thermodesulfobacteriota bacterium]HQO79325.1 hypothetical protein [Thermodesulfobacteriota bacterium]
METTIALESLFGALAGSLITIILTRAFSILQRKSEQKLVLERLFFERKLQAAEHAMSQWHASAALLQGIVALYERITTKEREVEFQLFRVTSDALTSQWLKISQAANDLANTVVVYFDPEESAFINAEVFKKLLDLLASIRSLDVSLKFALDLYEKYRGTRQEDSAWEEVQRITKDYQATVIEIASIFSDSQKEMVSFLQRIRREVRKYESR